MTFLHTFHPQSVFLEFGPIKIHWYGLLMVIAIFAGILLVTKLAQKYGINKEEVHDIAFNLVIFSLIGARIYAVLLFPKYYFQNPLEIVQVWKGGLAIHGAVFGGITALYFYCKKKKKNFWMWADFIVPALALGQAIGRWGNYFNQELFGKPTSLPWGIPIEEFNRPPGFENFDYFHPTFLYESILNLIVFLVLIGLHYFRIKNKELRSKSIEPKTYNLKPSTITLLYLILYSVIRIIMEQFRIDETPVWFGMRLPVLMSILLIIGALLFYFYKNKTLQKIH